MSASTSSTSFSGQRQPRWRWVSPCLDAIAILLWGILLLKYWITQKLYLLIHPNYIGLVIAGGVGLLVIGSWRAVQLLLILRSKRRSLGSAAAHITLLPPGWGSILLIATAVIGLSTTPRVFNSDAAFQRGVMDAVAATRTRPQAFRSATKPEQRSLVDWIRTLNVYPEPDKYTGQNVNVKGFVIHTPDLPDHYFLIARFVLTCCAADAYPISLPVKLEGTRNAYPPDTWLQVQGKMMTEVLNGKRQLTIAAQTLTQTSEPKNPYEY
jgi:uncharacterized repeat protein (TIGR03943 family)